MSRKWAAQLLRSGARRKPLLDTQQTFCPAAQLADAAPGTCNLQPHSLPLYTNRPIAQSPLDVIAVGPCGKATEEPI